jgi:hypothetical protein
MAKTKAKGLTLSQIYGSQAQATTFNTLRQSIQDGYRLGVYTVPSIEAAWHVPPELARRLVFDPTVTHAEFNAARLPNANP